MNFKDSVFAGKKVLNNHYQHVAPQIPSHIWMYCAHAETVG